MFGHHVENSPAPDVIVVLGAKVLPDGQASAALRRRMRVAVSLYHAGVASRLLLAGRGPHAVPEADVMRQLAIAEGIPDSALILEPGSRNTLENAREAGHLLSPRGWRRVVLVTDRYHVLRARLLFWMAGMTVVQVQTTPVPLRHQWPMILMECVKLPVSVTRALLGKLG